MEMRVQRVLIRESSHAEHDTDVWFDTISGEMGRDGTAHGFCVLSEHSTTTTTSGISVRGVIAIAGHSTTIVYGHIPITCPFHVQTMGSYSVCGCCETRSTTDAVTPIRIWRVP